MSNRNDISELFKENILDFLGKLSEKIDFNKIQLDSIDELVDKIYETIINGLDDQDKLIVDNHKLHINKDNRTIDNLSININGVFYDKKKIEFLLKKYIKSEKKNVYYVKKIIKANHRVEFPSLIKLSSLYKHGIITLYRSKKGEYYYSMNVGGETSAYNQDKIKKGEDYISDDVIKSFIRSSIVAVAKDITKKVVIPTLGATVVSSILGPSNAYQAEKMKEIVHTVKYGENITLIAQKYGVSVDYIIQNNPDIDPNLIKAGQKIVVKYENVEKNQKSNTLIKSIDDTYDSTQFFKGIDISSAQGDYNFDLEKVYSESENGIDYVILRSHNFIWNDQSKCREKYLDKYVEQIKRIKEKNPDFDFAIYFLPDVRSIRSEELVRQQAHEIVNTLEELEKQGVYSTFPIYLDVEKYSKGGTEEHSSLPAEIIADTEKFLSSGLTIEDLHEKGDEFVKNNYPTFYKMKIFTDVLGENGYLPGFYTSIKSIPEHRYDIIMEYIGIHSSCFWPADYNTKQENNCNLPEKQEHDMNYDGINHQYRIGTVKGYDGEVDLNSTNRDYRLFIEKNGFNHTDSKDYRKKTGGRHYSKISDIIEYFKSLVFKGDDNNTIEGNSFYFEKQDYQYEQGIISIEIDGEVINAYCEKDPSEIQEAEPFVIKVIGTGKEYTITRLKSGFNSYILIPVGLYSLMYLNTTPNFKEFYGKLLNNVKEKLENNKKIK